MGVSGFRDGFEECSKGNRFSGGSLGFPWRALYFVGRSGLSGFRV